MGGGIYGNAAFLLGEIAKTILIMLMAAWLFFDSPVGLIILLPYAAYSIYGIARRLGERQRSMVIEQFKDTLGCLLTALEAGYSIERAVPQAREDMILLHGERALMVTELSRMANRLELSENIEDIIEDFAAGTGIREIENFSDVFSAAKRSNGDIIALIRSSARDMYEKIELKREIEGVIASVVNESRIMKMMPLLILLYMRLGAGSFMDVLYNEPVGRFCMIVICVLYFVLAEYTERIVASVGR